MMKQLFAACIASGLMTLPISAQQTPAAPVPAQARPEPPSPSGDVRRRNVSIEVKLTDQTGTAEPVTTKVVSMIVADGRMGSVRSAGSVMVPVSGPAAPPFAGRSSVGVTLNVDANPVVHQDGSVLLSLKLEYNPRPGGEDTGRDARLEEGMSVTLESGKALVISRAADPAGNRKINVEVTATVMK
jgi:hypothetical protein